MLLRFASRTTRLLIGLGLLSACEQNITQKTVVPTPTVNVVVQPSVAASSKPPASPPADPATAATSPDSSPSDSPKPSLTASAQLPTLNLNAPISGASPSPLIAPGIDKFADSIPAPVLTKDYDARDREVILLLWQKRYEQSKDKPYEVLKMYLDAGMIAWYNESLASTLNAQVLATKTPWLFPNYTSMDAQAVAKSKEYAIRSYFRGTSPLTSYSLVDFEARTVNLVNKNSRGEYKELNAQDLRSLAPPVPHEGDSFKCHLYSSASRSDVELTMLYKDGWKVDFWTPNILVAFMP